MFENFGAAPHARGPPPEDAGNITVPAPARLVTLAPVTAEQPMEVYICGVNTTSDKDNSSSTEDHRGRGYGQYSSSSSEEIGRCSSSDSWRGPPTPTPMEAWMDHLEGLQSNPLSSNEPDASASVLEINSDDSEAQYAQCDAERRAWHSQRSVSEDWSRSSELQLSSDSSSDGRTTCERCAASSRQRLPRTPRQFQAISGTLKAESSSDEETSQRLPRLVRSARAQDGSPHAHRRQPQPASSCHRLSRCFD